MPFYLIPLVVILAVFSIRIIQQYQTGVVFQLGKYSRTLQPGLNFIIPINPITDKGQNELIIEIDPNNGEAYYIRAVTYYHLKEYDKAWDDAHKSEKLGYAVNSEFMNALKKVSSKDK